MGSRVHGVILGHSKWVECIRLHGKMPNLQKHYHPWKLFQASFATWSAPMRYAARKLLAWGVTHQHLRTILPTVQEPFKKTIQPIALPRLPHKLWQFQKWKNHSRSPQDWPTGPKTGGDAAVQRSDLLPKLWEPLLQPLRSHSGNQVLFGRLEKLVMGKFNTHIELSTAKKVTNFFRNKLESQDFVWTTRECVWAKWANLGSIGPTLAEI